MAYNRKNKLQLILDVQRTYTEHKQEGITTIHVYRTYIRPVYHISLASFYNYLATPASAELKRLEKEKPSLFQSDRQMSFQFA